MDSEMSRRDHAGVAAPLKNFPKWRRFWRCVYAAEAAQGRLPMMLWGPTIGAVGGALVALDLHPEVIRHGLVVSVPSSGEVVAGAGIGAALGVAAAFLFAFLWAGGRYFMRGDDTWEPICDPAPESASVVFELRCRVSPPQHVETLGHKEAAVKRPDGTIQLIPTISIMQREVCVGDEQNMVPATYFRFNPWGVTGEYEVRWYGTNRKHYEIARKKFWIEAPEPTQPAPPPAPGSEHMKAGRGS